MARRTFIVREKTGSSTKTFNVYINKFSTQVGSGQSIRGANVFDGAEPLGNVTFSTEFDTKQYFILKTTNGNSSAINVSINQVFIVLQDDTILIPTQQRTEYNKSNWTSSSQLNGVTSQIPANTEDWVTFKFLFTPVSSSAGSGLSVNTKSKHFSIIHIILKFTSTDNKVCYVRIHGTSKTPTITINNPTWKEEGCSLWEN